MRERERWTHRRRVRHRPCPRPHSRQAGRRRAKHFALLLTPATAEGPQQEHKRCCDAAADGEPPRALLLAPLERRRSPEPWRRRDAQVARLGLRVAELNVVGARGEARVRRHGQLARWEGDGGRAWLSRSCSATGRGAAQFPRRSLARRGCTTYGTSRELKIASRGCSGRRSWAPAGCTARGRTSRRPSQTAAAAVCSTAHPKVSMQERAAAHVDYEMEIEPAVQHERTMLRLTSSFAPSLSPLRPCRLHDRVDGERDHCEQE